MFGQTQQYFCTKSKNGKHAYEESNVDPLQNINLESNPKLIFGNDLLYSQILAITEHVTQNNPNYKFKYYERH